MILHYPAVEHDIYLSLFLLARKYKNYNSEKKNQITTRYGALIQVYVKLQRGSSSPIICSSGGFLRDSTAVSTITINIILFSVTDTTKTSESASNQLKIHHDHHNVPLQLHVMTSMILFLSFLEFSLSA